MHHLIGALVIGAFAGGLAGRGAGLRPVFRGVVKKGITAKRKVEAVGATARRKMQRVIEEARAELDQAGTERQS
jgi:hypothetical protein